MKSKTEKQSSFTMISDLAYQLSAESKIKLTSVEFDDGRPLSCSDIHMLSISSKGKSVHTKLNNDEVEGYPDKSGSKMTKAKISAAIDRLKLILE